MGGILPENICGNSASSRKTVGGFLDFQKVFQLQKSCGKYFNTEDLWNSSGRPMKGLRAIDGMWGKSGYRITVRRLSLCRRSVKVIITHVFLYRSPLRRFSIHKRPVGGNIGLGDVFQLQKPRGTFCRLQKTCGYSNDIRQVGDIYLGNLLAADLLKSFQPQKSCGMSSITLRYVVIFKVQRTDELSISKKKKFGGIFFIEVLDVENRPSAGLLLKKNLLGVFCSQSSQRVADDFQHV